MIKPTHILLIALLAVFVAGCSQAGQSGQVSATDSQVPHASPLERPVKEFTVKSFTEVIDGKYFPQFSPNNMTVDKGDLVRIKITNIKGTHDFRIDEFDVYAMTPLNEEVVVEFVADKAGSFEYYCTQPGHRTNGHWGTLTVLDG